MSDEVDRIRRWQAGDVSAFAATVRRWQTPIARFLARMIDDSAVVADLTQEVFLKAHLAIGRYRIEGTFSTWLYRIALNQARDWSRRTKRQPVELAVEIPERGDVAIWERREIGDIVQDALRTLTDAHREVLVMRHFEGLGFEEMARLLDVPATTLKSRFAVALTAMRDRLRDSGYGDEG